MQQTTAAGRVLLGSESHSCIMEKARRNGDNGTRMNVNHFRRTGLKNRTHLHLATHLAGGIHPRGIIADDGMVRARVRAFQRANRTFHTRVSRLTSLGGLADVAARPRPSFWTGTGCQVRQGLTAGERSTRAFENRPTAGRLGTSRTTKARRTGARRAVGSPVVFAAGRHVCNDVGVDRYVGEL